MSKTTNTVKTWIASYLQNRQTASFTTWISEVDAPINIEIDDAPVPEN